MNNEDKIIEILEDNEIQEDAMIQIMNLLESSKNKQIISQSEEFLQKEETDKEIINEKDPFRKAAFVAQKISRSLDE